MTDRNIVRMVNELEKRFGRKTNFGSSIQASADGIFLAEVVSVQPVSIRLQGQTVSNVYLNPALAFQADDIQTPFETPFEPAPVYEFLKEFHSRFVLKPGDTVIAVMSGTGFYIAGKAVAAK